MEFQLRSENTGIRIVHSFEEALEVADRDRSIWKISFTIEETRERVRLTRANGSNGFDKSEWILSQIPTDRIYGEW